MGGRKPRINSPDFTVDMDSGHQIDLKLVWWGSSGLVRGVGT